MIGNYLTLEQKIREEYKIDIDIFYHDIQYSYVRGKKYYGNKLNYAKDYIRIVKKMYLEVRNPALEHHTINEMVSVMEILEKKEALSKKEKALKEDLHRTLVAKRLLEEAILFVGDGPFEKIGRRIDSKRSKRKTKSA